MELVVGSLWTLDEHAMEPSHKKRSYYIILSIYSIILRIYYIILRIYKTILRIYYIILIIY